MIADEERRLREMNMLLEVSRLLDQSLDLRDVVSPVLEALAERLGDGAFRFHAGVSQSRWLGPLQVNRLEDQVGCSSRSPGRYTPEEDNWTHAHQSTHKFTSWLENDEIHKQSTKDSDSNGHFRLPGHWYIHPAS